jgi:integrase
MPPPAKSIDLEPFHTWLLENGRSPGTARLYCINVGKCLAHEKGSTGRLIGHDLAPNTMATNRAALKAYADFTEDAALLKRLGKIRLPPAQRMKPKFELTKDDWRKILLGINQAKISRAKAAALTIICLRGLRCSDVLRLKRSDVVAGLKSGRLVGETKGRKRIEWKVAAIRPALEVLVAESKDWETVTDLIVPRCIQTDSYKRRHQAVTKLGKALRSAARYAEVEGVHPHRLRRTYATYWVESLGPDPRAIPKLQAEMGWSNMATAVSYVDNVNRDELDQVGEAMIGDLTAGLEQPAPKKPKRRRPR